MGLLSNKDESSIGAEHIFNKYRTYFKNKFHTKVEMIGFEEKIYLRFALLLEL